jgi:NADH-quinone oxidoreductase subunit H
MERKVIARFQDRIGPNRVGRYGLGQSFADIAKLLTKEQITPAGADKLIYNIAPILMVMTTVVMWAILPFGPGVIGADLNIGLFYFLAVSSVSVVAVLMAGWGSNNKYALLGAFRSVAQLVSYEVPMVIALLIPILLARSMSTQDIIAAQVVPFFFVVPLSALIFLISALAETGRTPFDLLEAESEIIAGFHIEYSGMKFAMFQLAEFVGAFFMGGMLAVVYFGGWNIPIINLILGLFGVEPIDLGASVIGTILGMAIFQVKMFMGYFLFIWSRATLPRIRIDQILDFNWKFLVPISLVMLLTAAILDKFVADLPVLARSGAHLASNLIIMAGVVEILRRRGRNARLAADENLEDSASYHDGTDHGHGPHAHMDNDHVHETPPLAVPH